MTFLKNRLYRLLRWSEKYTETDMVYLAYAGFWNNLNAFILAVFSLVLYIVYAHFLSKEEYGTYQYLLSFFSIATAFTLTGMNTAVTRAVAQGYEGTLRESVRIQLKYGIIPFLGALAGALYYAFHGNMLLSVGLVIIGMGTPLLYAFNTYGALFAGRKDFKRGTIYSTISNVFYYAALIAAAFYFQSPLFILGVNLGVQVILSFVLYTFTLHVYRPNEKVDKGALSYGMHLSFMSVFASSIGQLDNIFIFHFLGPVQLAIYSFATAVPQRLSGIFFKFLGAAALPKFSERTIGEIRSKLLHKMLIAYGVGAVVAIGSVITVPIFFHIFFPTYLEAIPYAMFYSLGIFLGAAHFLPTTALTALKRTRELYIINIATPIAQVLFPLAGLLLYGLWGVMWGTMFSLIFAVILSTTLVYRTGE